MSCEIESVAEGWGMYCDAVLPSLPPGSEREHRAAFYLGAVVTFGLVQQCVQQGQPDRIAAIGRELERHIEQIEAQRKREEAEAEAEAQSL